MKPIQGKVARRCFTSCCCTTRDGYRAKDIKHLRWFDCTGDFFAKTYCRNKYQTVNESSTCPKIIYDKHLHGSPYFKVYRDFALTVGEESDAYTAWPGILDDKLIVKLEAALF